MQFHRSQASQLLGDVEAALASCGMSYRQVRVNVLKLAGRPAPWNPERLEAVLEEAEASIANALPQRDRGSRPSFLARLRKAPTREEVTSRLFIGAATETLQAIRFELEDLDQALAAFGATERRLLLEIDVDLTPLKTGVEQARSCTARLWSLLGASASSRTSPADPAETVAVRLQHLVKYSRTLEDLALRAAHYSQCVKATWASRADLARGVRDALQQAEQTLASIDPRHSEPDTDHAATVAALDLARDGCARHAALEAALQEAVAGLRSAQE